MPKKAPKSISISFRFHPDDYDLLVKAVAHIKATDDPTFTLQRLTRKYVIKGAMEILQRPLFDASSIAETPASK